MSDGIHKKNKALVLDAFDTLFNKRDYAAAVKYWSSNYIQHSAHIPPGRDGLFNLIRSMPAFRELEGPEIGSPPMSSGWPRVCSQNTGMFCRMKRPKRSRKAVCRCLGPRFPSEESQSPSSWFSPLNPKDHPKNAHGDVGYWHKCDMWRRRCD